jgi:ATP-dependent helicase/DNAse subunit B
VHPREQRVDAADAPEIDQSQQGDIREVLHSEAQRVLAEDLARPMSPSRLDIVIQCPYRFFAQSLLRLDDLDIDDVRLTPLERGTLLHDVADRWYRRLRNDAPVEITPSGVRAARIDLSATTFDHQWGLLATVVEEVLAEQSHVHAFAPIERRALVGDELRPGLLKRWLALEREDQLVSGFMPALFEQEIEISIDVPTTQGTASVQVKTRIDRIDLREIDGVLYFSVVDYKSTLSDSFAAAKVQQGLASQMPIYLTAVRAWFASHGIDAHPEAAVYRAFGTSLQTPVKLDRRVVLADAGSPMISLGKKRAKAVTTPLSDTLDHIMGLLHPGITQVQSAVYPVRPRKGACDTCRVAQVCRKDHWGMLTTIEEESRNDEEGNEGN